MKKSGPTIRILELFKSRKKAVLIMAVFVMAATGLDLSVPLISQKLIDRLIDFFKTGGAPPFVFLFLSAGGILAATVLSRVFNSLYNTIFFKPVIKRETKQKIWHLKNIF